MNPGFSGGRDRRRSGDLTLFRRALYQLSYPTVAPQAIGAAVPTVAVLTQAVLTVTQAVLTVAVLTVSDFRTSETPS